MKKYNYSISTGTIWTSFDYGTVEAESYEEAKIKAMEQIEIDFEKAREFLIKGKMDIYCDSNQVQITEI